MDQDMRKLECSITVSRLPLELDLWLQESRENGEDFWNCFSSLIIQFSNGMINMFIDPTHILNEIKIIYIYLYLSFRLHAIKIMGTFCDN